MRKISRWGKPNCMMWYLHLLNQMWIERWLVISYILLSAATLEVSNRGRGVLSDSMVSAVICLLPVLDMWVAPVWCSQWGSAWAEVPFCRLSPCLEKGWNISVIRGPDVCEVSCLPPSVMQIKMFWYWLSGSCPCPTWPALQNSPGWELYLWGYRGCLALAPACLLLLSPPKRMLLRCWPRAAPCEQLSISDSSDSSHQELASSWHPSQWWTHSGSSDHWSGECYW